MQQTFNKSDWSILDTKKQNIEWFMHRKWDVSLAGTVGGWASVASALSGVGIGWSPGNSAVSVRRILIWNFLRFSSLVSGDICFGERSAGTGNASTSTGWVSVKSPAAAATGEESPPMEIELGIVMLENLRQFGTRTGQPLQTREPVACSFSNSCFLSRILSHSQYFLGSSIIFYKPKTW